ncbi:unnamed protein product [Paramecium primaurelia]|uniref:uracil phosphoribosyltransferase n=1 Tax=Paramecium primaurelia TaxID=5886 RepID=A0A8S1QM95_PARPR|nr:unnamed protein product [Paramecium primaurelia]
MFKNLLGLVNGTQMAYSQLQNDHSYNRMQHYNFLSQNQLHNLLNKHRNLFILHENQTQHIYQFLEMRILITFSQNSDRLIRMLLEQVLAHIEKKNSIKLSPLGFYDANQVKFSDEEICIVSILRCGNAFLNEALKVIQGASIGQYCFKEMKKHQCQSIFFEKLPKTIYEQQIILVDPMLGTGGSVSMALKILQNYVSCEQGLKKVFTEYPNIKIIIAQVDPILIKEINYLTPGIGDFGDRYFGTVKKHTRAEYV